MPDFPGLSVFPPKGVIGTSEPAGCQIAQTLAIYGQTFAAAAWPAANRALFYAVQIDTPITIKEAIIKVGTQSGNVDIGIYDWNGNRIVSKGTTAVGAAGNQTFDLTASVTGTASPTLEQGTYFMAMACDNTTATFLNSNVFANQGVNACHGVVQAATSFVLPSSVTYAATSSLYIPYMLFTGATL